MDEKTKLLVKKAYNEGWMDYHVFQNPKRGTLKIFSDCWKDSESRKKCECENV